MRLGSTLSVNIALKLEPKFAKAGVVGWCLSVNIAATFYF